MLLVKCILMPVVATDVGELGELVKRYETGLVFQPEDAASLSKTLSLFLNYNHEQREIMRSNYDKFYNESPLSKWAEKSIDIIEKLYGYRSR